MFDKPYRLFDGCVRRSREWRTQYLRGVARVLVRVGVSANVVTLLSLLSGLAAVWFVFSVHIYFVFFGVLHLLFDALDGVVAREGGGSTFGKYFDAVADNMLVVMLLGKAFLTFDNFFYAVIGGLYMVQIALFLFSRMRAPAVFGRSVLLIAFFLGLYYAGAVAVGAAAMYGLFLQLHYQLTRFKRIQ